MDLEEKLFFDILQGRFNKTPKGRSRVVRIFVSSTFTDTHAERDYLIEFIYPQLKTYCKQQYALDFQVLDMRWGIGDEATNNHMATDICINEIRNSQKASIGPNFVALLSHRYGNRDLPTRILVDEYQLLKDEMMTNPDMDLSYSYESNLCKIDTQDVLEFSYQLDENETPFRYRLKNINKIIPDFVQKNPGYLEAWETLQQKLSILFRTAADNCFKKDQITETQRNKYFVSITEKEVFSGVLQNPQEAENNAIVFIRDIKNIANANSEIVNTNPSLAGRFIELDQNGKIDEDAKNLLDELKYKRVPKALPASNIHKFEVNWDPKNGISRETHKEYLEEFGTMFLNSVKELIDRNAKKSHFLDNFKLKDKQLIQEVLEHAIFCNESVEKFHGRQDLIEKLKDYVINNKTDRPFIVYGESGCGKTSVIAKFASEMLKLVPEPQNYVLVLRFLGTTPGTSNITAVFQSVIYQLARIFNMKIPERRLNTKSDMRDYLNEQLLYLSITHPEKKIVIMLDSIDQLSTADYNIEWMITELPRNVKMIYSTLPNHGDILKHLKSIRGYDDSYFVEVTSLTQAIVVTILDDWLSKNKRSLSESQWKTLNEMFEKAKLLPLYVKLIFDIIVKWTSFHVPNDEFKKCINIDKSIEYLFKVIEKSHGKILFSRCLCYMSSFKNGISENELEDILSIDDDVLYEIFAYHAPPVRRFPAALWARIKHDLSEYMVEKEADETRVIYWYHRRFIEVANSFYVSKVSSAERENVFSNVIDFFNETWKDKPKPYKFNDRIAKKKNLVTNEAQASRNTTTQPTEYSTEDGIIRYNKRKLTELPGFIGQLTANLAVPLACKHIYFNYQFSHGQFTCCNYMDIIEDIKKINQSSSFSVSEECKKALRELKFLNYLYLQCLISMNDYPDSMAIQILSRLLLFYGQLEYVTAFIKQADEISPKHCALVAPWQFLPPPGIGPLFTLEKHRKPINCCVMGGDNDSYVFTLSTKIHAFNMMSVKSHGELELPKLHEGDEYKYMNVYFATDTTETDILLNLIDGSAVVISDHLLYSVNFDATVNFSKTFETLTISKMFQISTNHIVVGFKDTKYFEVYNMNTGDLVATKAFDTPIKFLECNMPPEKLFNENAFKNVKICIVLKNNEVHFYKVTSSKETPDRKLNDVQVDLIHKLPPSGLDCVNCLGLFERYQKKTHNYKNMFCLTYKDGSYGLFDIVEQSVGVTLIKMKFQKPKLEEKSHLTGMQVTLKLVDSIKDTLLFLSEDQSLYLYAAEYYNASNIRKIGGSYNDGRLVDDDFMCGISKGLIDFYQLKKVQVNKVIKLKALLLMQIEAHFMDITRILILIKDGLMITTSKDSTLKAFHLSGMKFSSQFDFKLERTLNETKKLFEIDSKHFGTYTDDSSLIYVWNVSNGKIVDKIDTKFDYIYDLEFKKGVLVVIGILTSKNSKNIVFQSYLLDTKGTKGFSWETNEKIVLDETIHASLLHSTLESTFVVLNKTVDHQHPIKLNLITYKRDTQTWTRHTVGNLNNSINISAADLENIENFNNVGFTDQTQTLTVYYKNELFYLDSQNGSLLARKSFKDSNSVLNYFIQSPSLSDGKTKKYFYPIADRCDFIAINSLKQLVYIDYTNDTKIIQLYTSSHSDVQFSKIEVFRHILCAYSELKHELYVFNLKNMTQKNVFKNHVLKHEFPENSLQYVCVGDDCEYLALVEDPKLLSLFRLSNGKRIAHVPLYNEVNCLSMSDHFVVIGMQDKRIISLLIADPLKPDHQERIQALESRNYEKNLTKKRRRINDLIVNKVITGLDNYSAAVHENIFDDDEKEEEVVKSSSDEDDEKAPKEVNTEPTNAGSKGKEKDVDEIEQARKKMRNNYRKNIKVLVEWDNPFIEATSGEHSFEANWLIDLYKKGSLITQKEIDLLRRKNNLVSQLTIQHHDINDDDQEEVVAKEESEVDKKELMQALIENENDKVKFQNTKHNVAISNTQRTSSNMCNLM